MSEAPNFNQETQAPKKGGGGWKWILIILGGLCAVCCCGVIGGGWYLYSKVGFSMDPTVARTRASEIVDMQVPAGFEPQMSMDMFDTIKMVMWIKGGSEEGGVVLLMQVPGEVSQAQLQAQMDMQMKQQGKSKQIVIEEKTEKEYTIRGQTAKFEFNKGKAENGTPIRQIVGTFPAKGGTALLMVIVPESGYDEAEMEAMINSIK